MKTYREIVKRIINNPKVYRRCISLYNINDSIPYKPIEILLEPIFYDVPILHHDFNLSEFWKCIELLLIQHIKGERKKILDSLYFSILNNSEVYNNCKILIEKECDDIHKILECLKREHTVKHRELLSSDILEVWKQVIKHYNMYNHSQSPENACTTINATTHKDTAMPSNVPYHKDTAMPLNVPYISIEYVYGKDISSLQADDLLTLIKRSKAEIKSLKEADVKSTYIDTKIKELSSAILKMVERLDTL